MLKSIGRSNPGPAAFPQVVETGGRAYPSFDEALGNGWLRHSSLYDGSPLEQVSDGALSVELLSDILTKLRKDCKEESAKNRHSRIHAWRSWLAEDWSGRRKDCFQMFRGNASPSLSLFKNPNGSFTGNLEDIDKLLQDAWMPLFRKFAMEDEPSWDKFHARFEPYIQQHPLRVDDITGDELKKILFKLSGMPGLEGWRVQELKLLPVCLLELLAVLFNVIEHTGRWPKALERA
eukprot:8942182-Karenia_brevis.AAC.1